MPSVVISGIAIHVLSANIDLVYHPDSKPQPPLSALSSTTAAGVAVCAAPPAVTPAWSCPECASSTPSGSAPPVPTQP